jgi:hypothetical protein
MRFSVAGQDPPPPGESSRWETLRAALAQTISPFDAQIAMGAKFFPEVVPEDALGDPVQACRTDDGVGIAPARGHAAQILGVFAQTEPRGGTPSADALRIAADDLLQSRGVARTMVLATDGAPNCNPGLDRASCVCTSPTPNDVCAYAIDGQYICLDDARTVTQIGTIFQTQKIPVYVIGIGGLEKPEFHQVLDAMAVAGGRPLPGASKYYNVQSSSDLTTALTAIRDSVTGCTYLTPSAPTDPNAISIDIDSQSIPRDPSHLNGWDWVDQTYGEIAFFGAACAATGGGTAHVTGVVSCTSG